jgi:phage minor structural protein
MSLLDFKVDQQFMQTHTLSFRLTMDDVKTFHLREDAMLEFEDDFYFIDEIKKSREENESYLDVVANALWYRLGERKKVGKFRIDAKTPAQGLNEILEAAAIDGLDWIAGLVSGQIQTYSLDATDSTYLDLIYQWAKITSCEVDFNTRAQRVHLVETVGADYGLSFRYQRNLTSISRVVVPPQVTRLYGYGRLDLTMAGVNPSGEEYIEDYSFYTDQGLDLATAQSLYRKDETYKDDSFVDDVSLYQAMVSRLAALSQPIVSYSASVVDLSQLTGLAEGRFGMGDRVVVDDAPLGISVTTRVVRFVRFPYEPERNQVELSFMPVTLPDDNVSSSRDNSTEWNLFEHRNTTTPLSIREGYSIIHQIPLRAQQDAAWMVHATVYGTAVGNSNITFVPFDPLTGEDWFPSFSRPFSDGELVDVDFSFAQTEIASGRYVFALRVFSDTAGAGVDIVEKATSLWVMAKGAVRETIEADNSITFEFTGAVQYFTVPDNVYQIKVTSRGSRGGQDGTTYGGGGYGQLVEANFWVIPGQTYHVYVGGYDDIHGSGGWPNGGASDSNSGGDHGFGGGGATYLIPELGSFTDALLVAGAGGGQGAHTLSQ